MPVFEYRCSGCAATLEVILLAGEVAPEICPDCGGSLKRLWSRVGVQLVGWGFARNDALLGSEGGRRKPFTELRDKASELFD